MSRKKQNKCYVVLSEKNYVQAGFPLTKEGKVCAKEWAATLTKKNKESYRVEEK